ncbi:MAG: 3-deoxy-7-phosphoheptulonate synthase [Oscillospiraceae bacterium]|nr:3-deoxy-7-phosphoheptulonate synthase [Oscillospiraceae bacterium]
MIIIMAENASEEKIKAVEKQLAEYGFKTHPIRGESKTVIGAIGDKGHLSINRLLAMDGVENVVPIMRPYKLAGKEIKKAPSIIDSGGVKTGDNMNITVFAGPYIAENEEMLDIAASCVSEYGGGILTGGVFNQGPSPYGFESLGIKGLTFLKAAGKKYNIPVCTEIPDTSDVETVAEYCDVIQIGARNMQNYSLLSEAGKTDRTVILKRGLSASVEEWLMAAEYIMKEGNSKVILCERGIRTFETATRSTLDISAIPVVKSLSHLPVIAEPGRAAGNFKYVGAMSKAALAAGADGLMLEIHPEPNKAHSNGERALKPKTFTALMRELKAVASAVGREI